MLFSYYSIVVFVFGFLLHLLYVFMYAVKYRFVFNKLLTHSS